MKRIGKTMAGVLLGGAFLFGGSIPAGWASGSTPSPAEFFRSETVASQESSSTVGLYETFAADSSPLFGAVGPFSEIIRGNFADLEITPFQFRCVGTVYGEWGDYTRDGGKLTGLERGFKTGVWGGTFGADRIFGDNLLLGLHASAGRVDIRPEDDVYDGSVLSVGGIGRMTIFGKLWYWDFSLGAARNRNSASGPADGGTRIVKKNATQMNYQTEIGLKVKSGFTNIEPFFGLRYVTLSTGGIDLTPSRFPFSFTDSSDAGLDSCRTLLGSRFSWEYATYVSTIRPFLRGMWVHEYGDESVYMTSDTLLLPIAGEFGGLTFPRDRAVLGVGVTAALRDMVDLYFSYDTVFASEMATYSINGGFNVKY